MADAEATKPRQTTLRDAAYPPALAERERQLLRERWRAIGESDPEHRAPHVGFALSGGGIRSATFCLGLFQGLAKRPGLLGKIDFLSTVSGGGYFGGFFGRLCSRRGASGLSQVEAVLDPDAGRAGGGPLRRAVPYLRENGRYLSPNGAGDLLLGGAVLLRNWVSIQVVLWSFVLMLFLGLQVLRVGLEVAASGSDGLTAALGGAAGVKANLWWSPWFVLPLVTFVLFVVPLGWAYWLVESLGKRIATVLGEDAPGVRGGANRSSRKARGLPWWPLVLVLAVSLGYLGWLIFWLQRPPAIPWSADTLRLALGAAVVSIAAAIHWALARAKVRENLDKPSRRSEAGTAADAAMSQQEREVEETISEDSALRNELSRRLKTALVVTGALLGVALVDSLGQTLYVVSRRPDLTVEGWIGGSLASLTVLAGFARRIAVQFGGSSDGKRVSLPLNAIATVAAIAVVVFLLIVADASSHAVARLGRVPQTVAEELRPDGDGEVSAHARVPAARGIDLNVSMTAQPPAAEPSDERPDRRAAAGDLLPAGLCCLLLLALSAAFGRIFPFVNRSSHHPLYSARLIRAYLGASNDRRLEGGGTAVTQVMPGDDISLDRYWPPPSAGESERCTWTPLHLVNVTVNETYDGKSQVQQQDRHGTGMAVGPAGISLGVRHHVVGPFGAETMPPEVTVYPAGEDDFRVFQYPRVPASAPAQEDGTEDDAAPPAAPARPGEPPPRHYLGEPLTLGSWVGISGAAFSTGLGARTSLGLSVLAGLANVRLGYWWDSGVETEERVDVASGSRGLLAMLASAGAGLFPVQTYLLDEIFARFPGTARSHWYLSDGGHFENMGGYELIRRRLPLIVVMDAEADPDYTFGGLSNLVRKARLDFGAEIEFLTPAQIDDELPAEVACHVGSLAQLRRGVWKDRTDEPGKRPAGTFEAADRTGQGLVHAALARVRYLDGATADSRLLYVKPSLFGDEAEDVLDYHRAHPDFPQETTADQFFDEAQWESYRRLGQHVAEKVFGAAAPGKVPPGGWDPRELRYQPAPAIGGSGGSGRPGTSS